MFSLYLLSRLTGVVPCVDTCFCGKPGWLCTEFNKYTCSVPLFISKRINSHEPFTKTHTKIRNYLFFFYCNIVVWSFVQKYHIRDRGNHIPIQKMLTDYIS